MTTLNNPLAALKHKNFLIFWSAMCISLTGSWMQTTAQLWLAYQLTDSAFMISLIGVLQFLPVMLFSVFAGVIIDKFPKKLILMFTQSASLAITFALALLVYTGQVQFWHILLSSLLIGFVNTIDMPTRQAFVIELVNRDDLMNAIALNSTIFNAARIIGPAVAGFIMYKFSVSWVFFANSASFAAVIIGMIFMSPSVAPPKAEGEAHIFRDILDGFKYILGHQTILKSLIYVAIVGTFGANFGVLVPVFTKVVLGKAETSFGLLMSFIGLGSLIGSIFIAAISRGGPKKFLLSGVPFLVALFNIMTGLTSSFALAAASLAVTGFFFVSFAANVNSRMQLATEDHYRGRVMSIYSLVFAGSTPLGNLYTGGITNWLGPKAGFIACGGIIAVLLVILMLSERFLGRKKIETVA